MSLARRYEDDGVVLLEGAALGAARAAYDWSLANPGPGATRFAQATRSTFFNDLYNPRCLEGYREMLLASPLPALIAGVWDAPDIWFMYEQVFLKEGGETRRTPWHQDSSYLTIAGRHLAVAWISFDAVPRADALEFVRGSHRGTLYNGSAFAADDDTAPLYRESRLPRLPDIEADRASWDIVSWDVAPGDLIFFHLGVLHGGAGTEPGMRRRTVSLRFLGPDVVYDGRPRDEKGAREGNDVALSGMYAGLRHGDPFRTGVLAKV